MSRKVRVEPQRPKRVVEQHGSLTFDSYLCCDHKWTDNTDLNVAKAEYTLHCSDCGAGGTRDERGRMVAYDRDWSWGVPPKQHESTREKARAA